MRRRIAKAGTVARRLLDGPGKKISRLPGVIGIGLGRPFSEKEGRWRGPAPDKRGIHWTRLALKVMVERKRHRVKAEHRIPSTVGLRVGGRRYRFDVDVNTLAGRADFQMAGTLLPRSNQAAPGNRCLIGVRPQPAGPQGNTAQKTWEVGTVAAVLGTPLKPFILTAGHVAEKIYEPNSRFRTLLGEDFAVGVFKGNWVRVAPPMRPAFPRTSSNVTIDVVAVPIANTPISVSQPPFSVPTFLQTLGFVGQPGELRVERATGPRILRGSIEAAYEPLTPTFITQNGLPTGVTYPPIILFRFQAGHHSVGGDSGAPLIVHRQGQNHLLGVHFARAQRLRVRQVSLCTPIRLALGQVGRDILSS